MTILVVFANLTVLLKGQKIFEVENGVVGAELSALPNEPFKKVIGKKGV